MFEVFDSRRELGLGSCARPQGSYSKEDAESLAASLNKFVHEQSDLNWLCDASQVRGPFFVRKVRS